MIEQRSDKANKVPAGLSWDTVGVQGVGEMQNQRLEETQRS